MLWISMGTSPLYTFFTGVMEIAAGLLLVVPRLATVGALLSTAIMGNVVMLNLGYDVKVKLTSINLTLMGLVILLPQLPRLVDFFLLNRSVPALNDPPLFRRRSLARAAVILQIAFGLVLLSYNLYRSYQVAAERAASKQTPLYGVWFVDDYVIDGRPIPPLSSDTHRWHRFIVDSKYDGVVEVMTGVTNYLLMRPDPVNHKLVLTQSGNPNWIAELTYDNATPSSLVLSGKMGGSLVLLRLHREDESKFPLKAWKYSWVFDGER